MSQYARPIEDTAKGSWTRYPADTTFYTQINEETKDDDSTYIRGTSGCGTCIFKLGSISAPSDPSTCTFYVYQRTEGGGAPEKVDIDLIEDYGGAGEAVRGSWANKGDRGTSYVNGAGAVDLSAVTDWSNLYVRLAEDTIGSGEYWYCTQIYLETPDVAGGQQYYRTTDGQVGSSGEISRAVSGKRLASGISEFVGEILRKITGKRSIEGISAFEGESRRKVTGARSAGGILEMAGGIGGELGKRKCFYSRLLGAIPEN